MSTGARSNRPCNAEQRGEEYNVRQLAPTDPSAGHREKLCISTS